MIIGTASGLNLFPLLLELYNSYGIPYVNRVVGRNITRVLAVILRIVLIIMAGGGISVIIGSILVLTHLHKIGRLLITLGSGMGIIGSIVFIMWNITFAPSAGVFFLGLLLDIYFVGVILTIIGRRKMKIKEEDEFDEEDFEPLLRPNEPEPRINNDTVPCPVCDTGNPKTATYCRQCGTSLNYDLESYL